MSEYFPTIRDGEWVAPSMKKGWRLKCCSCGVIHKLTFKVIKHARGHKVIFRAFRQRSRRARSE